MTDRTPERPLYDMFRMRAQKEDCGQRGDGTGFWNHHKPPETPQERMTRQELEDLRADIERERRANQPRQEM